MVKKNFVSGIFVLLLLLLYAPIFYHYDLFVYRSKRCWATGPVFHQTLFIPICCGYTSFIDKCLGQYHSIAFIAATVSTLLGSITRQSVYSIFVPIAHKQSVLSITFPILNGDIIIVYLYSCCSYLWVFHKDIPL